MYAFRFRTSTRLVAGSIPEKGVVALACIPNGGRSLTSLRRPVRMSEEGISQETGFDVPSPGDNYDAPHLAKSAANFTALTPLVFLAR